MAPSGSLFIFHPALLTPVPRSPISCHNRQSDWVFVPWMQGCLWGLAMLLLQFQAQCLAYWIRSFVVILGSLNGPHPLSWGLSARLVPLPLLRRVVRSGRRK